MPPFQNGDEPAHFVRAWQVSRGQFRGSANPETPPEYLAAMLQTYPAIETDAFPAQPDARLLAPYEWSVLQTQVYWFAAYLPAAAAIRVASLFHLSLFAALHLARLANAAVFLAALFLALRAAPQVRSLLGALALMPMTWIVAASVSADSLTYGLSFLFFAMILRSREEEVSRRYLGWLLALTIVLVPCKYSLWALPLLALVPAHQFANGRRRAAWLASAVLISLVVIGAWRGISAEPLAALQAAATARGNDFSANAAMVASHPWAVLRDTTSFGGISRLLYLRTMLRQFGGVFGWMLLPIPHTFFYLPVLAAAAIFGLELRPFRAGERLLLAGVFLAAALATYAALYVIDGMYVDGRAVFRTAGVQGRYFIPYCLAGLLAVSQSRIKLRSSDLMPAVLAAGTLFGMVAIWTIYGYFYP